MQSLVSEGGIPRCSKTALFEREHGLLASVPPGAQSEGGRAAHKTVTNDDFVAPQIRAQQQFKQNQWKELKNIPTRFQDHRRIENSTS